MNHEGLITDTEAAVGEAVKAWAPTWQLWSEVDGKVAGHTFDLDLSRTAAFALRAYLASLFPGFSWVVRRAVPWPRHRRTKLTERDPPADFPQFWVEASPPSEGRLAVCPVPREEGPAAVWLPSAQGRQRAVVVRITEFPDEVGRVSALVSVAERRRAATLRRG